MDERKELEGYIATEPGAIVSCMVKGKARTASAWVWDGTCSMVRDFNVGSKANGCQYSDTISAAFRPPIQPICGDPRHAN